MKPIKIDNLFSKEELFFLYEHVLKSNGWIVSGKPENLTNFSNKNFSNCPQLIIKCNQGNIYNSALYLYGQSLVFRLKKILEDSKIGLHTKLNRMWFNITYNGSNNQWLHTDGSDTSQTILIFITPVWDIAWNGNFYVDGNKYSFTPGSAVIFDSKEYHTGEEPISATYNWLRLTCNITVEK